MGASVMCAEIQHVPRVAQWMRNVSMRVNLWSTTRHAVFKLIFADF